MQISLRRGVVIVASRLRTKIFALEIILFVLG